jgi:hypothetical protein
MSQPDTLALLGNNYRLQIIETGFAEQFYASHRMGPAPICLKISARIAERETYRMIPLKPRLFSHWSIPLKGSEEGYKSGFTKYCVNLFHFFTTLKKENTNFQIHKQKQKVTVIKIGDIPRRIQCACCPWLRHWSFSLLSGSVELWLRPVHCNLFLGIQDIREAPYWILVAFAANKGPSHG